MKILRFNEVKARVGLSRTTVWRLENGGQFPRRKQLSASIVGWLESDINEWIASKTAPTATAEVADSKVSKTLVSEKRKPGAKC